MHFEQLITLPLPGLATQLCMTNRGPQHQQFSWRLFFFFFFLEQSAELAKEKKNLCCGPADVSRARLAQDSKEKALFLLDSAC